MPATQILQRANRPGVTLTNFWLSDGTPAEYDGDTETCTGQFFLHPPAAGSVFRWSDLLPLLLLKESFSQEHFVQSFG